MQQNQSSSPVLSDIEECTLSEMSGNSEGLNRHDPNYIWYMMCCLVSYQDFYLLIHTIIKEVFEHLHFLLFIRTK